MKYEMKTDRAIAASCLSLVRPMNARIATVILLVSCPFSTALADTKVVLPHAQRFADTGRDFLLETTIPGDFKTLEGIVWGLLTFNTAAIQELVKGALEATIRLHTNKSTTVYYEIDGQIVEEWDA